MDDFGRVPKMWQYLEVLKANLLDCKDRYVINKSSSETAVVLHKKCMNNIIKQFVLGYMNNIIIKIHIWLVFHIYI